MELRRSKKGTLDDLVFIVGVLLFIGLLILIAGAWMSAINEEIQASDVADAKGKVFTQQIDDLYGGALDNSFLFLTIGLSVAALALAFLVVFHPIFFVFYFIMLAVVIYVSGVASNIYQTAAAESVLADVAAKLIFTSHILEFLPMVVGIVGFVLAVVMFKTWQENQ